MKDTIAVVLPIWELEPSSPQMNVGQRIYLNKSVEVIGGVSDEISFVFVPSIPGSGGVEASNYLSGMLSKCNGGIPVLTADQTLPEVSGLVSARLEDYLVMVFCSLSLKSYVEYQINQVWQRTFQRMVLGVEHPGITENEGLWRRRLDGTQFGLIPDRLRGVLASAKK